MTLSASQSRLHLSIGGTPFPVLGLTGSEALNRPSAFAVGVTAGWASVAERLGAPAALTLTASDGFQRRINGVLTGAQVEADLADGQSIVRLTVESGLAQLKQRTDSRLIVSQTLPEILRQTLKRNNIGDSRLAFHLTRDYPVRPVTLQARESDLDFVLRLAGRQGLLIWTDARDAEETVHIADTVNHCPALDRPALPWLPQAGLETEAADHTRVGVLRIVDGARMVPDRHWVHDVHENAPDRPHLAGRSVPGAADATQSIEFAPGAATHEEAQHQAMIRAQRAETIRHRLTIRTHAADLRPGALVRLDTMGYSTCLSGDYLITAVEHEARQYGGQGLGGQKDRPYTNTAVLVPRQTPFRPQIPAVEELPLVFTARIESREPTAELDPAGRYCYRQHPDSQDAVSVPIRRLQPHAGPGDTLSAGWHLPLHGENEVLISCLNNDPDRPMLAGTLANPAHPSVVTAENAHQNLLSTAGGNQLAMDDLRDKSAITLCTFDGRNVLRLDADAVGQRIDLAAAQGTMQWFAKKTMTTNSGDTLTETAGNDRIQQVENRHTTTTKNKEIHHQAKTDGTIDAGSNIQLKAEKNIELSASQDMQLDITRTARIHVKQRDAVIRMNSGCLNITADGAIDIQGDGGGTITFAQNGAGFKMAPNGDITLFGNTVSLNADALNFSGPVNKQTTTPPPMPADAAPETLAAAAIPDLVDQQPPTEEPVEDDPNGAKLAVEVAGGQYTRPQGTLLAVGAGGTEIRRELTSGVSDGHRRQIIAKDIPAGRYRLYLEIGDNRSSGQKIPLDTQELAPTCPVTTEKEQWDTVLVPIVPHCYTTFHLNRDKGNADFPRSGWVYIYVNGFLWRELYTPGKGLFSDVDLGLQKGKDQREATGASDTTIVLPYRINGKKPDIEICFSEIQWSWDQAVALGGLDPADTRARKNPHSASCPDKSKATAYRAKRMQPIKLDAYPDFDRPDGPIGSTDQTKDAGSGKHLPVFYLHDALGIAQNLVEQYHEKLTDLRRIVKGLSALDEVEGLDPVAAGLPEDQKAYYFQNAVLAYRTFFDPETTAGKMQMDPLDRTVASMSPLGPAKSVLDGGLGLYMRKTATDKRPPIFKRCAALIDHDALKNILKVADRRDLRTELRRIKSELADFLDGKVNDKQACSLHPDFVPVQQMLLDFANLNGEAYGLLWAKANGLHATLIHDPCSEDPGLDNAADIRAEVRQSRRHNPAARYLNHLLEGRYPELYAALFPTRDQVNEYEQRLSTAESPEPADGSGKFRPAAYRMDVGAKSWNDRPVDRKIKDVVKLNKEIIASYLFTLRQSMDTVAPKEKHLLASAIASLAKTADHPDLAGLRLIKAGSPVDIDGGKFVAMGLSPERLESFAGKKAFLKERPGSATAAPRAGAVPVYAQSGQPIGEMAAGRFTDKAPAMTRKEWLRFLYEAEERDQTVYKARCDLIVVDADSGYARKIFGALKTAERIVPPIVAVLEMINFSRVVEAVIDGIIKGKLDAKIIGYPVTSGLALAYYTLDAARAIAGEEALQASLNFGSRRIGDLLFEQTIKIADANIIVFKAWGAGVTAITALWSLYDMTERIYNDDNDAAAAAGVSSAAFFGLALAQLGRAGVTGLCGALGPYGWALFLVGVAASMLYYMFKDSELEAWAKHGPFPLEPTDRWTHVFKGRDARIALEALMGVLMKPSIHITYQKAGGSAIPDVVVEVAAPGYDPAKDQLTLHVTAEATPRTDALTGDLRAQLGGFAQLRQKCYKIEHTKDEHTGQVVGARYYFKGKGPRGFYIWRARARHVTGEGIVIPPLLGQADNFNPNSIGVARTNLLFFTYVRDKRNPGWIYAQLDE